MSGWSATRSCWSRCAPTKGLVGYGEIAGGPQKLICDLVRTFAAVITGMDPLGHVEIWQLLFSLTSPRPGGIGGWDGMPAPLPRIQRPQAMAAIGGIDIALWDLKGKAVGLPVFRLLGGTRTEVFTYATGGYYREGEPLEACARGVRPVRRRWLSRGEAEDRGVVAGGRGDAYPRRARRDRARCAADAGHERAVRRGGLHPVRRSGRAV